MSLIKMVCKVEWEGDLFEGVVVNDGVSVRLDDACVEGVKVVLFDNADKNVVVMYTAIQSISISDNAPLNFLQLNPVEVPPAE